MPASLGGGQIDPLDALDVVETLSGADGSTGWTSLILNTTFFAAWLEPAVAKEILDTNAKTGMAGVFGPLGRATPAGEGALRLTGQWPFNWSPHAGWFCEGAMVVDDSGAPEILPAGRPDWRFMFVPADEVRILDNWYVSGLRGTASHDVVIDGVLVPEGAPPIRSSKPLLRTHRTSAGRSSPSCPA